MPRTLLLPHGISSNLYTLELGRAYVKLGLQVVFSADNLAQGSFRPDIVHLQWPEEHYRWSGQGSVEAKAAHFLSRLTAFKQQGSHIVWTVHNVHPHEQANDALDADVYQRVIDLADLIVHHCPVSQEALRARYRVPNATPNVIAPHGNFFGYANTIGREEARRRLGINAATTVFLQFGQVRAYKGLNTLIQGFRGLRQPDKLLMIVGQYRSATGGAGWAERLQMRWIKHVELRVKTVFYEVPNDTVQLYMLAADAVVLSHHAGLNSGVAVLGMSFGKLVIAPALGCVPSVLNEGVNLLYPAGDVKALSAAMAKVRHMDLAKVSEANLTAARGWDWVANAQRILAALPPAQGHF